MKQRHTIESLSKQIREEDERLMRALFSHVENARLKDTVSEWETATKFLPEHVLDLNPFSIAKKDEEEGNSKKRNDYSGVAVQLTDLYQYMHKKGSMNDKYGEYHVDIRTDVDAFEQDMQGKFRGVQFATAKRVLSKFYRKITQVDQETHMDEDPGK